MYVRAGKKKRERKEGRKEERERDRREKRCVDDEWRWHVETRRTFSASERKSREKNRLRGRFLQTLIINLNQRRTHTPRQSR